MKAKVMENKCPGPAVSLKMALILAWLGLGMRKLGFFLLPEVAPSSASSGGTLSRQIPPATHQPMTAGFTDTHFNQEGRGGAYLLMC